MPPERVQRRVLCRFGGGIGDVDGIGPPTVEWVGGLHQRRRQVFEGPQQKSGPTKWGEAGRVDLYHH